MPRVPKVRSIPLNLPSPRPALDSAVTGCRCVKSRCLKRYCACFQGQNVCTADCLCQGCENVGGRDDELYASQRPSKLPKLPLRPALGMMSSANSLGGMTVPSDPINAAFKQASDIDVLRQQEIAMLGQPESELNVTLGPSAQALALDTPKQPAATIRMLDDFIKPSPLQALNSPGGCPWVL